MADNKRPMLPAPTVHCTLRFCIELCSFELLGSLLVRGGSDEFGYDADGSLKIFEEATIVKAKHSAVPV